MAASLNPCTTPFIGASEFTLTIALVVFVMITAILLFILVLLCISKSFRAFFFRDAAKRKKAAAKKNKQIAAPTEEQTRTTETRSATDEAQKSTARTRRGASATEALADGEKPAKRAARTPSKNKTPDIYDGIITVPLDYPVPPQQGETNAKTDSKRGGSRGANTRDDVPTIALPKTTPRPQQSEHKRTYTTRTVTITRARSATEAVKPSSDEKHTGQSGERSGQPRKKN